MADLQIVIGLLYRAAWTRLSLSYDTIARFIGAPWHAMCREILPRFGRRVQCRLARFDPVSGELDLDHLASLIDARTKLVCCTGASNFLGTRNPLGAVRALADASGYYQPNGERRSWLLIDGAQLVPGSFTDVHALGADYLAFSFHKLLAPFGVGVPYAREQLLGPALPFLYGGDMIAEGVTLGRALAPSTSPVTEPARQSAERTTTM